MSWVAVAVVAGAAIGYVGTDQTNKTNSKLAKGAGTVDSTTTRTGDPRADPYRDAGMMAAYDSLFTGQGLALRGDPNAAAATEPTSSGGAPSGGGKPINLAKQAKQKARIDAAAKKSGGGAGAIPTLPGPQPRKFDGMSGETDKIREDMMKLPEQNAGMYGTSEKFLTDTLGGTERNAYRTDAAGAAHAISNDPSLAEYQEAIKKSLGIGGGSAAGGGGSPRYNPNAAAYYMPPSSNTGTGYGASATGTDAALRKLVAGENPAGWDQMEAGISRKVNEGRAGNIRELRARAVGSGFYGGDLYRELETGAIAQGDQEMADSLAAARFGAYQNALGLGTQYDTSMADIAARERASAASSSASAGAAAADAASREKLAMYGMWGDSIGLGQQGRTSAAGALGDLAGMTSADQQAALQGVNALGASRRGDLGTAGDLSLGADAGRNSYLAAQRQQQVGNAQVNLGRGQLNFDRERFYDPFARISAYGDALNSFYGGLGSEHTVGTDKRAMSPAAFSSPYGGALQGAALGGQTAGAFQTSGGK